MTIVFLENAAPCQGMQRIFIKNKLKGKNKKGDWLLPFTFLFLPF
jgi:hypothetical protein